MLNNPINEEKSSDKDKLTAPESYLVGERVVEVQPNRISVGRQPSAAYLESMRKSLAQPNNGNLGPLDFEYRGLLICSFLCSSYFLEDPLDETEAHIEVNFKKVTTYQKIKKIGRKTTCMAFCLLFFGIAMIVTSFFYVRRVSGNGGFYLFLLIGVCALIPGSYASYWVVGKFFGWYVDSDQLFTLAYESLIGKGLNLDSCHRMIDEALITSNSFL